MQPLQPGRGCALPGRRAWRQPSTRLHQLARLPLLACPQLGERYPGETVVGGMGGSTDGTPSLLVGLPGRQPGQALHANVTSGSLLLAISGPGVEAVPLTARGMRSISQVGGWVGCGARQARMGRGRGPCNGVTRGRGPSLTQARAASKRHPACPPLAPPPALPAALHGGAGHEQCGPVARGSRDPGAGPAKLHAGRHQPGCAGWLGASSRRGVCGGARAARSSAAVGCRAARRADAISSRHLGPSCLLPPMQMT